MHPASAYLLLLPATLATPVADPDPIFVPFHPILAPHLQHPKIQFNPLFGPGFPFNQPPQQPKQNPVLVIHTLVQNPNQRVFGGNQLQTPDSFDNSLFGSLFHGGNSLFGKIFGGGGIVPANSLFVPSRSLQQRLATTPSTKQDVQHTTPRFIQLYPETSTRPNEEDDNQTKQSDEDDSDEDVIDEESFFIEDDSDRDDGEEDDEDSEKDSDDPKAEDVNVPHIELLQ